MPDVVQVVSSVAAAPGGHALLAGFLVAAAVLSWPRRLSPGVVLAGSTLNPRGSVSDAGSFDGSARRSIWQEDPLLLLRRWRLQRNRDHLLDGVLILLDSMAPALAMGLPPARALALAAQATSSETPQGEQARGRRQGFTELDRLTGSLAAAAQRGEGLAAVWAEWARLTGAPEMAFVASAWALSEQHGAPLAVAVQRGAAGLREARARKRRVQVAVAGPRATITVLTVLPLAGPAFGVACGIDPATLYLGSPVGTASVAVGVALIVVGRLWCGSMVRRAVAS